MRYSELVVHLAFNSFQSGGEFGVFSANATPGTGLPGRFGVDYAFINKVCTLLIHTEALTRLAPEYGRCFCRSREDQLLQSDVSYGANVPRRDRTRQYFQRNSECDTILERLLLIFFQYFSEYEDAINYITQTKGAYALLDPHNYMRYKFVIHLPSCLHSSMP